MKFKISILLLLLNTNRLSNSMQCLTKEREPSSNYIYTKNCAGYDKVKKLISLIISYDLYSKLELSLKSADLIKTLACHAKNFFTDTLIGHTDSLKSLSFSPDSRKLATCSYDSTAKIWDLSTGELIHNLSGPISIDSIAFSPDGSKFATGSWDGTTKIWDVDSGNLIHHLIGHTRWVNEVIFSPDSSKIATCNPSEKKIKIWDVETGNLIHDFTHTEIIQSISFSPDNKKIAAGSWDNTAKIWDVDSGNLIHHLIGHTHRVGLTAFSPNGKMFATGSKDETIKIWDVDSGNLIHDLTDHYGNILSLTFSPDNKKLVTTSDDKTARIWDTDTGNLIHTLLHNNTVWSASFSPDGQKLASGSCGQTAIIWSETGNDAVVHASEIKLISFSHDWSKFATSSDDYAAKIWDVSTGRLIHDLVGYSNKNSNALFSLDSKKVDMKAKIFNLYKIDPIEDAFKSLNYEQLELLEMIYNALKYIKDSQYIKLSSEQKAIVDSLPACIRVPLKMALKNLLTKFITSQ